MAIRGFIASLVIFKYAFLMQVSGVNCNLHLIQIEIGVLVFIYLITVNPWILLGNYIIITNIYIKFINIHYKIQ